MSQEQSYGGGGGGGGVTTTLGPYIVGPSQSDYTTIGAAISAAATAGATSAGTWANIYIKPGTYNESLTLADGINLIGLNDNIVNGGIQIVGIPVDTDGNNFPGGVHLSVKINGNFTVPDSVYANIQGIEIITNSGTIFNFTSSNTATLACVNCCLEVYGAVTIYNNTTGSATDTLAFSGCSISDGGNGGVLFNDVAVTTIALWSSTVNLSGTLSSSTSASLNLIINNSYFATGATTINSISSFGLNASYSNIQITLTSSTGFNAGIEGYYSTFTGTYTLSSPTLLFEYCDLTSYVPSFTGTVVAKYFNCMSIGQSGSGDTGMGPAVFAVAIVANAGYQVVPQDCVIACTTASSALTVTLPHIASVPAGTMYIVKDYGGDAGTHNITVSGNGTNIDGASTKVISTNYGALRIISANTLWNTI